MDKKLLKQNLERELNTNLAHSTFRGIADAYGENTVNRVQKHRHGRKPRLLYNICDKLIVEYRSEP